MLVPLSRRISIPVSPSQYTNVFFKLTHPGDENAHCLVHWGIDLPSCTSKFAVGLGITESGHLSLEEN
eukprot:767732-Hanusia_phi.AAC.2